MPREVAAQRPPERDQRERHDHDSKNDMRDQDSEINRPDRAIPLKAHVADMIVIDHIRDEKGGGDRKCAEHAGAMRADPAHADKDQAGDQQDSRDAVENRIEWSERVIGKHHLESGRPPRDEIIVRCRRAAAITNRRTALAIRRFIIG